MYWSFTLIKECWLMNTEFWYRNRPKCNPYFAYFVLWNLAQQKPQRDQICSYNFETCSSYLNIQWETMLSIYLVRPTLVGVRSQASKIKFSNYFQLSEKNKRTVRWKIPFFNVKIHAQPSVDLVDYGFFWSKAHQKPYQYHITVQIRIP